MCLGQGHEGVVLVQDLKLNCCFELKAVRVLAEDPLSGILFHSGMAEG